MGPDEEFGGLRRSKLISNFLSYSYFGSYNIVNLYFCNQFNTKLQCWSRSFLFFFVWKTNRDASYKWFTVSLTNTVTLITGLHGYT